MKSVEDMERGRSLHIMKTKIDLGYGYPFLAGIGRVSTADPAEQSASGKCTGQIC